MTQLAKRRVGIIVLAAGASTRLGTPKQLLHFRGRSLLRLASETALASGCDPVVVVLGADPERMKLELDGLGILSTWNPRWEEGMASSIKAGLAVVGGSVDAVIILLCDQPLVDADLLRRLVAAHVLGAGLAAAEYGGSVGVPALFGRDFFADLEVLTGQEGAKRILLRRLEVVKRIPFPEAAVDIDAAEDLSRCGIKGAGDCGSQRKSKRRGGHGRVDPRAGCL